VYLKIVWMGRPAPRVRYNAKARGSVAGSSGKRVKSTKDVSTGAVGVDGDAYDSNVVMITPAAEGANNSDPGDAAKAKMKAEVCILINTIRERCPEYLAQAHRSFKYENVKQEETKA
jgi:hypothetical protein